jgi:hypothetical protein
MTLCEEAKYNQHTYRVDTSLNLGSSLQIRSSKVAQNEYRDCQDTRDRTRHRVAVSAGGQA